MNPTSGYLLLTQQAPVAVPSIRTLTDDFTTQDVSKWAWTTGTSVVGGQLQIATSNVYPAIISTARYDARNAITSVELIQAPNVGGGSTSAFMQLRNQAGTTNMLRMGVEGGVISAQYQANGSGWNYYASTTFNATAHKIWRIRESGGQLYYETSSNGIAWSVLAGPVTTPIDLSNVDVVLQSGYWGTEPTPGTALYDNFNGTYADPPPTPRTFYVSPAGADTNDGLSTGAPLKTLAKVNSISMYPGDVVLLARGGTWAENLTIAGSGTSAAPIRIGAYGTGALPIIDGGGSSGVAGTRKPVEVYGSWVVLEDLEARGSIDNDFFINGSDCIIRRCTARWGVYGIKQGNLGARARITGNTMTDVNVMIIGTGPDDDSGAMAVLLNGDGAEVDNNTMTGSWATSPDYVLDGSGVDVYNGTNIKIHHNTVIDCCTLVECGGTATNNVLVHHNVYRSSLSVSAGLTAHGQAPFGPVTNINAYHNTMVLTGNSSNVVGVWTSSGADLDLRNNIIVVTGSSASLIQAPGTIVEAGNVFYGTSNYTMTQGFDATTSVGTDPRFIAPYTDLHIYTNSPAVDRGVDLGYTTDFDGVAKMGTVRDSGAYEAVAPKAATFVETFDGTALDAKWAYLYNPGSHSVGGGQLTLPTNNAYHYLHTPNNPVDLTGSSFTWSMPTPGGSTDGFELLLVLAGTADDTAATRLGWGVNGVSTANTVSWQARQAAVVVAGGSVAPSELRYLRVREAGGTVTWESSADGTTWVQRATAAATIPITGLYPTIIWGTWAAANTTYVLDGLNEPISAPAFTGTATLSGAGSLSAAGSPADTTPVSLASSGILTAAGTPGATRAAALTGSGALSGTGAIPGGLAAETWPSATAGAAWPAQWTTAASGGSVTQDGAGRGVLTSAATANGYGDNAYLSGITPVRDLDLTVDVRFPSIVQQFFVLGLRSNNSASATTAPTNMYYLQINPNSAAGTSMEFGKFVAGVQTRIASWTFGPAWVAGVSQLLRFQAVGNQVRVKWWTPGSAEPAAWGYTVTDTSLAAVTGSVWAAMYTDTATARSVSLDNLVLTDGTAGANIATGTAATTGAGTLTAAGAPRPVGTAALTGSGALTGVATLAVSPFSAIADSFDTGLSGVWTQLSGPVTGTDTRARIPVDTNYNSIATASAYTIAGAAVFARLTPPSYSGGTTAILGMSVNSATAGTSLSLIIDRVAGTLKMSSESGYFDGAAVTITYNPTAHVFCQIRESAGTVFWETSPSGKPGSWTTRRSVTTPTWVATDAQNVQFTAHRDAGTVDVAEVDYFNTVPTPVGGTALDLWHSPQPIDSYPQLTGLGQFPLAMWEGDWDTTPQATLASWATQAAGKIMVVPIYAIPNRDSGGYSAGGFPDQAAYLAWVTAVKNGAGSAPVWYILEPDALGLANALPPAVKAERLDTLSKATAILKQGAQARVYIDASFWLPPSDAASLLISANVAACEGFATNVSAFETVADCYAWADQVVAALAAAGAPGKKYVIDSGRAGRGKLTSAFGAAASPWITANETFINPPGRGAGLSPRVPAGKPNCAALLWIKGAGGSDGNNPGSTFTSNYFGENAPGAGTFWPRYAENALSFTDPANLDTSALTPSGSAVLSGSGALTVAGSPANTTPVTLSGAGTLTGAGSPGPVRAAALTGVGALTTATAAGPTGSAPLSGSGSLIATAGASVTQSGTVSGAGSLSVTPKPLLSFPATVSGSGTLTAAGVVVRNKVTWAGRSWTVRQAVNAPPQNNTWGNTSQSVDVLPDGSLKLAIAQIGGVWTSAEVWLDGGSLGYGRYRWVYDFDVANLDPQPVFGLFTYETDDREIDIETTKWNSATETSHQWYSIQSTRTAPFPAGTVIENRMGDHPLPPAGPYTAEFVWQAGQVYFRTTDANGLVLGEHVVFDNVPPAGAEQLRMNLWLQNATAPSSGQPVTATVRSFDFTAGVTHALTKGADVVDGFDDPYGWALRDGAAITSGDLVLPCNTTYSSSYTGSVIDLRESFTQVDVSEVPAANGNFSQEALWYTRYDADNYILVYWAAGGVAARLRQAGVNSTQVSMGAYSPTTHRLWRVEHTGTTITFRTSGDGVTWTTRGSLPTTLTSAQLSMMRTRIEAGHWAAETSPGQFRVAQLGAASQSATGSAALTGGSVLTSAGKPGGIASYALTGSGALAATTVPASTTAGALTGNGTLTASAAASNVTAAAVLVGAGSLSTTAAPASSGAAGLAGLGLLTPAGAPVTGQVTTLTGTGALAAAGTPRGSAAGVFAGAGALTAAGVPSSSGAGALTGAGTVAAGAVPSVAAVPAALVGSGTLTAAGVGREAATSTATLAGSGALTAAGTLHQQLPFTSTFTGADGAAWPSEWTVATFNGGTATIQANRGQMVSSASPYGQGVTAWLSGAQAVADAEAYVELTLPATVTESYFGFGVRANSTTLGNSWSPNGYFIEWHIHSGFFAVSHQTEGSFAIQTTGTLAAGVGVAGHTYGVRLRAVGAQIQLRVWDLAGSEPTTWDADVVDASPYLTAGQPYVSINNGGDGAPVTFLIDNLVFQLPSGSGAGTFAGAGALTTTVVPRAPGAGTLSGAGTLTAASDPSTAATTVLSGTGGLAAAGALAVGTAAVLSGSGALSGSGQGSEAGRASVALSGSGALSTTAVPASFGAAALTGAGALAAGVAPAVSVTGAATGAGALTAAGTPVVSRPAALTGAGALTTTAALAAVGAAVLGGSGVVTVSATASQAGAGSAALTGSGALTTAVVGRFTAGAVFAGTGVLTVSAGVPAATGVAALAGAGVLAVSANVRVGAVTGVLSGSGALTGSGTGTENPAGTTALAGAGVLAAGVGTARVTSSVALAGSGQLTTANRAGASGAATFTGVGALTGSGGSARSGAADLTGTGILAGSGSPGRGDTVSLTGDGALTLVTAGQLTAQAQLAGLGDLAALGVPTLTRTTGLSGNGVLTAAGAGATGRSVTLSGAGVLTVSGRVSLALPGVEFTARRIPDPYSFRRLPDPYTVTRIRRA